MIKHNAGSRRVLSFAGPVLTMTQDVTKLAKVKLEEARQRPIVAEESPTLPALSMPASTPTTALGGRQVASDRADDLARGDHLAVEQLLSRPVEFSRLMTPVRDRLFALPLQLGERRRLHGSLTSIMNARMFSDGATKLGPDTTGVVEVIKQDATVMAPDEPGPEKSVL
ncbi:hypothetical protein [Methylobacterium nodulans]|nr:hypothetical protein [Methylobacterium nodulans]